MTDRAVIRQAVRDVLAEDKAAGSAASPDESGVAQLEAPASSDLLALAEMAVRAGWSEADCRVEHGGQSRVNHEAASKIAARVLAAWESREGGGR